MHFPLRKFFAPSVSTTRKEPPSTRQNNSPGASRPSTCCMSYRPCRQSANHMSPRPWKSGRGAHPGGPFAAGTQTGNGRRSTT